MASTQYYQYNQRTIVHSGENCSARLPKWFSGFGVSRILLLSDAGLAKAGIVERVAAIFESNDNSAPSLLAGVHAEIAPDASFESVDIALQFARDIEADAILAVGGGSVMDAAKGIKYALSKGAANMAEVLSGPMKMETWPKAQPISIPHIAMPTTSGTGAEISSVAVLYNEVDNIKSSLISPYISADMAVLDPSLSVGLPPALTASTGLDALTHALETVASPRSNHMTFARAIYAAQLIEQSLPKAVSDGANIEARADMMQASTMAMDAFSMVIGPVPVHNCAHAFGATHHIPHGDANAVLLPIVMKMLPEFYLPSAERIAGALNMSCDELSGQELLDRIVAKLCDFQRSVGCVTDFSRWNVNEHDADKVLKAIVNDPGYGFFPIPEDKARLIITEAIGLTCDRSGSALN